MRYKAITSAVLLLLALCAFFSCLYIAESTCEKFCAVTVANYNYSTHTSPLSISSLERFGVRISHNFVSFCCECDKTQIKGQQVTPVLTNHSFFSLSNIRISGEGITQTHTDSKEKVVVISKNLAIRLFFTTECIGRKLTINGEKYTVSGVYFPDSKTPIDALSRDNSERVYLPYTCIEDYQSREIHTLIYDHNSRSTPIMGQICINRYHLTNLYEKEKAIESLVHITVLYVYLLVCIAVMYIRGAIAARLTKDIKENLSKHYFVRSFGSVPHKYLLLIFVLAVVPVLMLIVIIKGGFDIYIPSQYIPQDNLFDIESYIRSIADNAGYMNSLSLAGDTYLPVLYRKTFSAVLATGLLTTGLFTGFVCSTVPYLRILKSKITKAE
ncbi:MAG: ABC transporter permease [Ruminococcus sp.]|nr:ABC transporter permease [Ruminococcus sp.]